jgi:hypothetical protein
MGSRGWSEAEPPAMFISPLRGLCRQSGWELGKVATVTGYSIQHRWGRGYPESFLSA